MFGGLLDLRDLEVSDVMVHRTNMLTLNADLPPEELIREIVAAPYSRLPIWRDDPENIIGVLHAKDLLRALDAAGGKLEHLDVESIALKPWFVPDTTPVQDQLQAFLKRKTHVAIVVDEYGVVMGLVTLEDILEEIVGDISDEHDLVAPGRAAAVGRLGHRRGLGADPRFEPRDELEPAGRGGDDDRRPRHP